MRTPIKALDEPNAELMAQRRDGVGNVALRAQGCRVECHSREGQALACNEVSFGTAGSAGSEAFADEESIGGNGPTRVMMESSPAATFVVPRAKLLLEIS